MPPNSMSREHDLPSSANAHYDFASFLRNSGKTRLYQPYCVTEASSRPQSPDPLVPKPLRVVPACKPNSILTTPDRALQRVDVNNDCNSSTTTTPDKSHQIAALETGSKSSMQLSITNRKPLPHDTQSVDPNHIAQAVTPRGSHLLAPRVKLSYDQTTSLRAQSIKGSVASPDRIPRREFLQSPARRIENEEKVPLLNTVVDPRGEDSHKVFDNLCDLDEYTKSVTDTELNGTRSTGAFANERFHPRVPHHSVDTKGTRSLLSQSYKLECTNTLSQPAKVKEELPLQNLDLPKISHTPRSRDPSRSLHAISLLHYHTQFPSSEADYTPRGLSSETKEGWAHRRTEPKDAQLRYQFGHRPSLGLNIPPPAPPHRYFGLKPTSEYISPGTAKDFTPSAHTPPTASHDPQAGPRPPPWISFETLEIQRRQRGDARERADAALLRSKKSSTSSLHQGSVAGVGLGKGKGAPRNEVEEYRVAVLSVYPDMEFDGEAGKGGRECCCFVM